MQRTLYSKLSTEDLERFKLLHKDENKWDKLLLEVRKVLKRSRTPDVIDMETRAMVGSNRAWEARTMYEKEMEAKYK